jgi:ABC-type sulfate/molybdate transport systems ATPase subunit
MTRPILAFDRVSHVAGAIRVLDGISFELAPASRTAIVGRSGSGKSLLLRLAAGLAAPLSGQVALFGEDFAAIARERQRLLRSRCGIAFQGASLIGGLSVEDNLWLGLPTGPRARRRLQARLDRITLDFAIEHAGSLPVEALSAGERRRVELARAFLRDPELLLLDEPLEGARAGAEQLEHALRRHIVLRGRALLLVTQDEALALRLCERVLVLEEGRLVQQALPEPVAPAGPSPA